MGLPDGLLARSLQLAAGPMMPGGEGDYPTRDEVVGYLAGYEERYGLPMYRPVRVEAVAREGGLLVAKVKTGAGTARVKSRSAVSATGTWSKPFAPEYPRRDLFRGKQVHSAFYRSPEPYRGKRVLIVGGGNSAAQVLAEVSRVAAGTAWATLGEPRFLPDGVGVREVFERATERYKARLEGREEPPADPEAGGLGDIVVVPSVEEARGRSVLRSAGPFERFAQGGVVWPAGREKPFDAVIWCTGFRPALDHLKPLGVVGEDGRIEVKEDGAGTRSVDEPRLWLVGYGEWTGFASATLIGAGRSARVTVEEIAEALREEDARSVAPPKRGIAR